MVDAERLNMLRLYLAAVGLLLVSLFTGCTYVEHHHHYAKPEPEPIHWYPSDYVPMPTITLPEHRCQPSGFYPGTQRPYSYYGNCYPNGDGWSICR